MIRITEDERRKIAADLRENRDPLTPYNLVDYIFDDPWNHDSGEEVADRLADLIEPEERTCRNMYEGAVKAPFTCSACGKYSKTWYHMWFGDMYADVPNFCPNCGAKVVRQ